MAGIDWDAVWRGDTSGVVPHVDEGLEVAAIPGKGRGVRATAPLAAGTLLLAEQALATAPEPQLGAHLVSLCSAGSLTDLDRRRLALMCDGEATADPAQPVPMSSWPPSWFPCDTSTELSVPRMDRVVDLNAYRCSPPRSEYAFVDDEAVTADEESRHSAYGVFPLGSLVNHSCAPNVSKVLLDDWVFLRAARDIEPGEELTQFYCDIRMPLSMRRSELKDLFGFVCSCPRCTFEDAAERMVGDSLECWRGLYSCQVPFDWRGGQVPLARLEGLVAAAARAARAATAAVQRGASLPPGLKAQQESWLLWPLVPALCQLAARCRKDGRLAESLQTYRRAERAAAAVVPLSNIHLRVLSEVLSVQAQRGVEEELARVLQESRAATTAAYGGGLSVWQELVGFRMPDKVVKLAKSAAERCAVQFAWRDVDAEQATGRRCATLTAHSPVFTCCEAVQLDVSPSLVVVAGCGQAAGSGADSACCPSPFRIDISSLRPRFVAKRHELVLDLIEAA